METNKLYYQPPSDEAFEDMRSSCIKLWSTMGDEPSYSKEKIGRIDKIKNVGDNFMYMFAMFDMHNQKLVAKDLKPETKDALRSRLESVDYPLSDYVL
jgi:hypothetical protein